ncbi:DUF4333 domain-containing protein [Nocardioides sp. C4-1]|uniref:DUF4333 domain-containing protein n=1 Tax=Nocardioides sp. C4-1 TaxID=3151851 RepID=UPI003263995A
MRHPVRTLVAGPAVVLALALAGCSSGGSVDQSDLEDQISTQLEEEVGQAPDDISCPGDLDAEEGETMECTLTAGEDELGVQVEVTSVDGDNVKFDIQVDEAPQ